MPKNSQALSLLFGILLIKNDPIPLCFEVLGVGF